MPDFLVRAAAGASTKSANKRAADKASNAASQPPAALPTPPAPRAPHPRKSGPPAPPPERFQTAAPPAAAEFKDPHADREALRYAEPIASREAILQLLEACDGPQTAEEIAEQLNLSDRIDALGKRLAAMVREAQLVQKPPRRLCAGAADQPDRWGGDRQSGGLRFPQARRRWR